MVVRRMAEQARREGGSGVGRLERRAESYEEGAELLRRLIASCNSSGTTVDSAP
jgi:hypothetical protein